MYSILYLRFFIFVILLASIYIKNCVGDTFKVSNDTAIGQEGRHSKLFPFLFAVLQFPTEKCDGDDGVLGVCYSHQDCAKFGGVASGICAEGYGTCCVFHATCSSSSKVVTIRRNVTHIMTPEVKRQQCRYVIPKQVGICQIRLDFMEFSLTGSEEGNCVMDSLTINGADNLDRFTLCGTIEREHRGHLYLHYGESDSISLNMNLERESSLHNIQVTMIRCNDLEKAPDGCTQYFTEEKGQVRSFNFPQGQLNGQRYMVCVKAIPGSSEIMWSTCNPTPMRFGDFFISGSEENSGNKDCTGDYIAILDSPMGKYCGSQFSSILSTAKPYLMWVNLNEEEEITPSGMPNPVTGCPFGWTCDNPAVGMPPVVPPCVPGDSCTPPTAIAGMVDSLNTGFCLQYNIK